MSVKICRLPGAFCNIHAVFGRGAAHVFFKQLIEIAATVKTYMGSQLCHRELPVFADKAGSNKNAVFHQIFKGVSWMLRLKQRQHSPLLTCMEKAMSSSEMVSL